MVDGVDIMAGSGRTDKGKGCRGKVVPREVVYDGTSTDSFAAEVNEQFHRERSMWTLDLSLCYDNINPQIITNAMKEFGFAGH